MQIAPSISSRGVAVTLVTMATRNSWCHRVLCCGVTNSEMPPVPPIVYDAISTDSISQHERFTVNSVNLWCGPYFITASFLAATRNCGITRTQNWYKGTSYGAFDLIFRLSYTLCHRWAVLSMIVFHAHYCRQPEVYTLAENKVLSGFCYWAFPLSRTAVFSERIFNTQHLCHENVYKDEIVTHINIRYWQPRLRAHFQLQRGVIKIWFYKIFAYVDMKYLHT